MSPEQLRSSKDVDARTDIWSLGVVLFEIVTGRMPFAADNLHEHYTKLMLDPPPLPTQVRGDLPAVLDAIVGKCLQRDPSARYANVGELAHDLAPLAPERARASAERAQRTLVTTRVPRSTSRPSLPAPPIALPPSISTMSAATKLTAPRRARRTARMWLVAGSIVGDRGGRVRRDARAHAGGCDSAGDHEHEHEHEYEPTSYAYADANAIAHADARDDHLPLPQAHTHAPPRSTQPPVDLEHRK